MKQALVTGGAHPMGIGHAAAKALRANGFKVTVTGVSAAEVALVDSESGLSGVVLDVRDENAVGALVESFDALDAVVNCAGLSSRNEFAITDFMQTLDVNLTGTMRVCVAARPKLARSKGAIVNVASMMATFGSPVVPGYSASKGGIVQLTKSLAAAWGGEGIRVNAIAPGWIKTNLSRPLWENPDAADRIIARTPLGRWGEAQDCGDVIGFLCSDQARFVSGVTIPVDGGYLVTP
ncbi:MAG: SDR family NAD(P)-dependent oxidoreductase [Caulobacterales bacterium]